MSSEPVSDVGSHGDADCIAFLQWALPRLGLRWAGYRKVRRQVCRRAARRARELGFTSLAEYRGHLEGHPEEWRTLDGLTNITISRFYRDRGVFAYLESDVLPALAQRARAASSDVVRAWSAGCASGEEAYTLAIMGQLTPSLAAAQSRLEILATDIDPTMQRRAKEARYRRGSLSDLPEAWRETAFASDGDEFRLRSRFGAGVSVQRHDIRTDPPDGPFDLILCRYLAFTYFDETGQRDAVRHFASVTEPGAALIIGTHENLPAGARPFVPWAQDLGIFRRAPEAH